MIFEPQTHLPQISFYVYFIYSGMGILKVWLMLNFFDTLLRYFPLNF